MVLGKVSKVNDYSSEVRIIGSQGLEAKGVTDKGSMGIVRRENNNLRFDQVEQKQSLESGDLVMLKGGDGWFGDLLVGRVGEIESRDEKVFKSAELLMLTGFEEATRVVVVKAEI